MQNQLQGVNFGGWFSQIDAIEEKNPETFSGIDKHIETFISSSDILRVKNAGFNHIRLPIDYQIFFSDNGEVIYEKRLSLCEKAVNEMTKAGLTVILDLHECPGHDFHDGVKFAQDFFTDSQKRTASRKVWSELCRRFGNKTEIYLEILNEPVAPTNQVWNEIKQEMAEFIRKNATESTLVIGSNYWNSSDAFSELIPLDDQNVLYSFHCYSPLLFTHQKAPWVDDPNIEITRQYPDKYEISENILKDKRLMAETGLWNRDRISKEIEPVLRFRDKFDLPVACNEFGVFHQAPRESQLNWIQDFLSILKKHDIGFSYWNYKNLDFGLISEGEKLHMDLPQFANDERLDKELLTILTSVY